MKEMMLAIGVVSGIMALVMGGIFAAAYPLQKMACESRWSQSGRVAEFGIFQGCLVESNSVMVPENRVWYERNQ